MSSGKMSAALDAAIFEIICVDKRELWLLDGIHRKPLTNEIYEKVPSNLYVLSLYPSVS